MLKLSHFQGRTNHGISAIPLFGRADAEFEKCASSGLLPDVVRYIEGLRPSNDAQYVLVNAMGAGEFYGSNINGDDFPEPALIHMPPNWTGTPLIDRVVSKNWPYGFPTFYNAFPYAHHRNKDSSRAFGEVELATWNQNMRRVELVVRVDHARCVRFNGTGIWDRLRLGQYPDVSMGTKVPYDTCSICLDWALYREALSTFNPKKHVHPGQAALYFHKRLVAQGKPGIRGLSITRNDYCEHAKTQMNKIYPDGRKVRVFNDFPRFFDISFVFIGADKTAKVMLFIFHNGKIHSVKPSAQVAEEMGVKENGGQEKDKEKTASVEEELLKSAFGKLAKPKVGEIKKDTVPSQFAGKAVPLLTRSEPHISNDLLDDLGSLPMQNVLSTTASMGIVLRPREFQRITLIRMGKRPLADDLDRKNVVFSRSDNEEPVCMDKDSFLPALAKLLLPLMAIRSALGPVVERRVILSGDKPEEKVKQATSITSDLLAKIGAAYLGYRRGVMDLVAHSQNLLGDDTDAELCKLGSAPVDQVFTPLAVNYLKDAYMDEFGVTGSGVVKLSNEQLRGEGPPLEEHVAGRQPTFLN
jgi:hypothetical protein